ncbi:MAG: hypothetical protein ACLP5H_06080 [Desulfomonilaceae bacterium]
MIGREYGWGLGVILGAVLISCFALPGAWAQEQEGQAILAQEVGRIERTQGATMVRRAGEADFGLISKGDPVFIQDTIGTDPTDKNAKIWWRHPSPVQMDASLGADSLFGFIAYGQEGPASSFVGSVPKGIIRFIRKLPATQPESSFTIITPTALIQVLPTDRAADYVVSVIDDNHTAVTVIWGTVIVRNIAEQLIQERQVTSCQMVIVEKDKDPSEVMPVGSDTLRELIRLTTIPNTLPTSVPSCEPPAQPVPQEQYIPLEFPEVIEGEPGIIIGPPGFVPIPVPPDTIDTIDTTDTTDTTITDTTDTTDTTVTDTLITFLTPLTFDTSDTTSTLITLLTPLTLDTFDTLFTITTLFTLDTTPPDTLFTFDTLVSLPTLFTFDTLLTELPTVLTLDTFFTLPTVVTFDTLVIDTQLTLIPTVFTIDTAFTDIPTIFTLDTGGPTTVDTILTAPTFGTVLPTEIPTIDTVATFATVSTVSTGVISTISTISTGVGTFEPFISTVQTGGGPATIDTGLRELNIQQQHLQQQQQHQFRQRPGQ